MSWAPEVIADGSEKYCGNLLRFGTKEEAELNAYNLSLRWTIVTAYRAVESTDPVNVAWTARGLHRL